MVKNRRFWDDIVYGRPRSIQIESDSSWCLVFFTDTVWIVRPLGLAIRCKDLQTKGVFFAPPLWSFASPVIIANGTLSFEDELRSGYLLYCVSLWNSVCAELIWFKSIQFVSFFTTIILIEECWITYQAYNNPRIWRLSNTNCMIDHLFDICSYISCHYLYTESKCAICNEQYYYA